MTSAGADPAALEAAVARHLPAEGRVGIAFSGGVDSATLLAVAKRSLGPDRALGIIAVSPSLPAAERDAARDLAGRIGAPLVEVATRELANPAYVSNGPDRCYHCKDELFTRIDDDLLTQHGLVAIAYGENADDALRPDRPGARAATEHRVLRPLAEAGLTKADVRALARHLRLPVADKPAAPCLASRIPHHEEVTAAKLGQIERAEAGVRDLGVADVRVRHHGEVARVELDQEALNRLGDSGFRDAIGEAVRAAGFRFVAIDLAGIQSGAFTLPLVAVRHG